MTERDRPDDEVEVQVAVPPNDGGRRRTGWAMGAAAAMVLVAAVVYMSGTPSAARTSVTPGSADTTPPATETTVIVDTVAGTEIVPTSAGTVDTVVDTGGDTVAAAPPSIGTRATHDVAMGGTPGSFYNPQMCNGSMPRQPVALVVPRFDGKTLFEYTNQGSMTFYWYMLCTGRSGAIFEIYTDAQTCTTNPALFDRMYAQRPAAGSPFNPDALPVRIDVSTYINCAATTTIAFPLPGQLPPPPSASLPAAPTTTTAATTTTVAPPPPTTTIAPPPGT